MPILQVNDAIGINDEIMYFRIPGGLNESDTQGAINSLLDITFSPCLVLLDL
jgi:hypothetical protein